MKVTNQAIANNFLATLINVIMIMMILMTIVVIILMTILVLISIVFITTIPQVTFATGSSLAQSKKATPVSFYCFIYVLEYLVISLTETPCLVCRYRRKTKNARTTATTT